MATLSVKEFLEAGVHYGHRTSRWNPRMAPYIYGKRKGIHIIDLRQTLRGLVKARRFLYELASAREPILFVGTKRAAAAAVRELVAPKGIPYVADRWLGGMLTNFQTVRRSLRRLEELEALEETGAINNYSKKMISALQREKRKILRNLQGVRNLDRLPAALVVIDPRRDKIAVKEAIKLDIPVVAMLDTDCDPKDIAICIPCNDDSIRSVRVVLSALVEAVEQGMIAAESAAAEPELAREMPAPPPQATAPAPQGEPAPSPQATAPAAEGESAPPAEQQAEAQTTAAEAPAQQETTPPSEAAESEPQDG